MSASIIYLLTLIGIALGIALGGVLGGVSFFLLHRIFTLSKRIDALEERLISTMAVAPTEASVPVSVSAPTQVSPVIAVPTPPVQIEAENTSPQLNADALNSLNTTLQALLPTLIALRTTAPLPMEAVSAEPASKFLSPAEEYPKTHAVAMRPEEAPQPTPQGSPIAQLTLAPISTEPHGTTHNNEHTPATPSSALPQAEGKTMPDPVAEDLNVLRDELSKLMNDITTERARYDAPVVTVAASTHETELAAKTLQELLVEVRRITANTPPRPSQS
jgi:hypothetical protein